MSDSDIQFVNGTTYLKLPDPGMPEHIGLNLPPEYSFRRYHLYVGDGAQNSVMLDEPCSHYVAVSNGETYPSSVRRDCPDVLQFKNAPLPGQIVHIWFLPQETEAAHE
jgi:hypothetical protein